MKKFNLSVAAILAMSTFALAGGDIEPVMEPVVETPAPAPVVMEASDEGGYVGIGYSYMDFNLQDPDGSDEMGWDGNAFTLLAGYNFNKYIAVEGRYSMTVGDITYYDNFDLDGEEDIDADISNIGIYLKPMLPMDGVTLYGLLGYGQVTIGDDDSDSSDSGFQWGLGANLAINDNVGVFVDYTRLFDDDNFDGEMDGADIIVDSWNVGIT